MRILFVTSEAHPLIKTGGLADVSASLPMALSRLGHDVRLLMPGYPSVLDKLCNLRTLVKLQPLLLSGNVTLMYGEMPDSGVPVLAIACPQLFGRDGGPYLDSQGKEWPDNVLRFGTLSRVAALLSSKTSPLAGWLPEITHFNDWQSGLTPAFMHYSGTACARTVLGIHNLAFQGNFPADWLEKLELPRHAYQMHGLEYYGQISFLKAGIYYADRIATVSPTYAQEIQTDEFGFGLQGLLRTRARDIHGILNGIDTSEWNPATDAHLAHCYDAGKLSWKQDNKRALQQQLGLHADATAPLLGVVSRLTNQKGLDLLLDCASPLLQQNCQLAILGSGDPHLEQGFVQLARQYPGKVSATVAYDETLSHRIMAGADLFIMPSRFEPCGLNQMYGLAYGTPPVVRRTGGLADSVTDTNTASLKNGTATGFVFEQPDAAQLLYCIGRALDCYVNEQTWHSIQRNGMAKNLGWDASARTYLEIYRDLLQEA